MDREIKVNDSAAHAPDAIRRWAEKLSSSQDCPVTLSREASGYHLYLPCPDCLHTHGRRELDDPKYSINLSMLAGVGEEFEEKKKRGYSPSAIANRAKKRDFGSSVCMRTVKAPRPHRYSIEYLMNLSTVTDRHPDILTKAAIRGGVSSAEKEEMWEIDELSGKLAPPPPGKVVPISELPQGHPAVQYLVDRRYDVEELRKQFRCEFCTEEFPSGDKQIFYRKMPGGWCDTPQNRIIFRSLVNGTPLTWQARVIEKVSEDGLTKLMLHPYSGGFFPSTNIERVRSSLANAWDQRLSELQLTVDTPRQGTWAHVWNKTHVRANPQAKWQAMSPFDEVKDDGTIKFRPSKYRTAKYSSRQMMGWDAAVKRADEDAGATTRWVVLCEGPLDAARCGPGGVALIGSSLSPDNAALVASSFHVVFAAFDNDRVGREAQAKITKQLMNAKHRATIIRGVIPLEVPTGKDLGDLRDEEYKKLLKRAMRQMNRVF